MTCDRGSIDRKSGRDLHRGPASPLAAYLRELRSRIDPVALGYDQGRRRTPGLRREEVARRAGISSTWYTWLEQGRGGAPSARVLDRVAAALSLTDVERDRLHRLGLGRSPEIHPAPPGDVPPRLQRVLDAFEACPALTCTPTWDVVGWNAAATTMFADYALHPLAERNVLRLVFLDPRMRATDPDWEGTARFVVGAFRNIAAGAAASPSGTAFIEELRARSREFALLWRESDALGSGDFVKRSHHPVLGAIALELSAFAVEGRPDLTMLVNTPLSPGDARRIRSLSAPRNARVPRRTKLVEIDPGTDGSDLR